MHLDPADIPDHLQHDSGHHAHQKPPGPMTYPEKELADEVESKEGDIQGIAHKGGAVEHVSQAQRTGIDGAIGLWVREEGRRELPIRRGRGRHLQRVYRR